MFHTSRPLGRPGPTLILLLALLGGFSIPAHADADAGAAPERRTLCVFDPAGRMGDYYRIARDYLGEAVAWGVSFKLVVYTDERITTEDLAAGRCDAALVTGSRARRFNRFTGTVEAIGGLPTYEDLGALVKLLASPKVDDRLVQGKFEVAAVFPAGNLYMLFRDRRHASLTAIAGKRIATLTYDQVSRTMVKVIGASVVPAEVATFAAIFNNGSSDICYSPVTAIAPLELLRGVGEKGGILRVPLAQITLQIILRREVLWPAGFSRSSRRYAARSFDRNLRYPRQAEASLPATAFIEPSPERLRAYEQIFRRSRLALRDKKIYDPTMLALLRRLRCRRDPRRAECADRRE